MTHFSLKILIYKAVKDEPQNGDRLSDRVTTEFLLDCNFIFET